MTTVMWFRRDLRLSDNPALVEAVRTGHDVVPLFVVDPRLWGPAGDNRRAFLIGCLRSLDESLDGRLVVRAGPPEQAVVAVASEVGAPWVFAAEDFGLYGQARDDTVARALTAVGTALVIVGSPYAVPPGEITTKTGSAYRVFTPYSRAWAAHGWPDPIRAPPSPNWSTGTATDGVPDAPAVSAALPDPGEQAAKRAARRFWDNDLATYADRRDLPGADSTSRLSPYLKWGCIHPRQLLSELGGSDAHRRFRTELCWREFYAEVLHDDPASSRRAWNAAMRDLRIDHGPSADVRFAAWTEGRTGYPLVDAGMRQLRAEGWMHNRVRMVTASFLVKDLHIDWTRGARHFMRHLVDGDLASNNHGWQWVSGTGTDASPFNRVFNPVAQSMRFDADGVYIRRHVHELAGVDAPAIHEPWTIEGGPPNGYPAPIIDHAAERRESLRRYDELRSRPTRSP